jgi:MFS family permease
MRLIAGIGLAGELGAGITLVSETMTQKHRGYGTMVVVSFGVLGAVAANLVALHEDFFSKLIFNLTGLQYAGWQVAYIIGGVLGILLLFLRIGAYESHMYTDIDTKRVSRGNFLKLFSTKEIFTRYLCCLAKDISAVKGMEAIATGNAVMFFYIGTSFGDFMSGYMSQVFKSRIKIILFYLILTVIAVPLYLYLPINDPYLFYWICAFLGIAAGYWAVFVTIASEQFGTNIRSTVTTTVPNFVRGSLVLLTLCLNLFRKNLEIDLITSCLLVGIISVVIAFWALSKLKETYHKDLGYVEMM